jgi:hypothetical protein
MNIFHVNNNCNEHRKTEQLNQRQLRNTQNSQRDLQIPLLRESGNLEDKNGRWPDQM